jgi:ElaB/YqjD/DUF883 family membrane-anchored ribosome-binding protein
MAKTDSADDKISATRVKLERTSSELVDKLELLQGRLQEVVGKVRRSFDFRYQAAQHPWQLFGGSVVLGFLIGRRGARRALADTTDRYARRATPEKASKWRGMQDSVSGELAALKGIAIGAIVKTALGMVREALLSSPRTRYRSGHNGRSDFYEDRRP